MTYAEQLKSPKWQSKRLEILERDGFKCRECGGSNGGLQVHHGYYEKGKLAWEYENKYLHTLCSNCHDVHHKNLNNLLKLTAEMLPTTVKFMYGILYYLNERATGGRDYDFGDMDCYADWIIENIQQAKGLINSEDNG